MDAYGYGLLLIELFGGSRLVPGGTPDVARLPTDMQQICKRMLNVNPRIRPSVSQLLEQGRRSGGFFQVQAIDLSEDIDSLGLKSEAERHVFLRYLSYTAAVCSLSLTRMQRTER